MAYFHARTILLIASIMCAFIAWRWNRHQTARSGWTFGLLAALALFTEVAGYVSTLQLVANGALYNGFILVEMILVLRLVVAENKRLTRWSWIAGFVSIVVLVADAIAVSGIDEILTRGILAVSLALSFTLLLALWDMARISDVALQRVPSFWLFLGMLAYFGALSPILGLSKWAYAVDPEFARLLWTLIPILGAIRYGLAAWAYRSPVSHQSVEIADER